MEQKFLTEKQHEIIGRLESVLKEAEENKIGFVYDCSDHSMSAFNAENVEDRYAGLTKEDESDKEMDWDMASYIENINMDYFDSGYNNCYIKFAE